MSYLNETLQSDFRDIKIEFITGNLSLPTPNINRLRKGGNLFFNQKYWSIIKEWKSKSTITGSACLYAFGLIDRLPEDIDLLVDKDITKDIKLVPIANYHNLYPGMEGKLDLLGYYPDRGYNVDLFHSTDHSIISVDGYNFHHPFEVIEKKIQISKFSAYFCYDNHVGERVKVHFGASGDRNSRDVLTVFKKLNPEYKNELAARLRVGFQ
jgi:hypothetical protein